MMSALWISASGLMPQQVNVDAIANNIANINTVGFKRDVSQFKDLLYQDAQAPNAIGVSSLNRLRTPADGGGRVPVSHKVFDQGRLEQTDNPLDIAIEGEGFFRVLLPDGTPAYTRDGGFKIDSSRQLATGQGYKLEPSMIIPDGARDISIGPDGKVSARMPGENDLEEIGVITLFKVNNLDGLFASGGNLFLPKGDIGKITEKLPGDEGVGMLRQGFLEGSNVELADEMAHLVLAQGAYSIGARAIRTTDEMLSTAIDLRS